MNKIKRKNGFTCLVKPFRSDSSQAKLTQPPVQSSQTKFRSCAAHSYGACFAAINGHATAKPLTSALCRKAAFTLAETMIVLIVLGVIAAITVPSLVRHQIDAANRAKIKKSMTIYDLALNKMVIENGIRGNNDLTTFAPLNNCTNTSTYFKAVENIDNNICKFRTSDGVWWDISDIRYPIVALSKDDLTSATADGNTNKAFRFVGHFDNATGILRVDDLKYETTANNATEKAYLEKLYGFLNKQSSSSSGGNQGGGSEVCETTFEISDYLGRIIDCHGNTIAMGDCDKGVTDIRSCWAVSAYAYDGDGNQTATAEMCSDYTDITSCNYCFDYFSGTCESLGFTVYNGEQYGQTYCKTGYHFDMDENKCVPNS